MGIEAKVNDKKLAKRINRIYRKAPSRVREVYRDVVTDWGEQAIPRVPVRAAIGKTSSGRSKFTKTGRGRLRQATQPFIKEEGDRIHGGIRAEKPYAKYLYYGTKYIAKGAVKRWKPGQPLITEWPAKSEGGAPAGAMPIIKPWHLEARDALIKGIKGIILRK